MGVWGSRALDFGQRSRGGPMGWWEVVKYYYILSCPGSMFESGDF